MNPLLRLSSLFSADMQNPKNNEPTPKIHLLMSVYLTDTPLSEPGFYGRNLSPSQNKVDQFLSTIHSLSKLNFSTAEVYFDMDSRYANKIDLICKQIREHIPNAKIHTSRLEYFSDWHKISLNLPDDTDVVLLKNNHDHVFTQTDPSLFYQFINDLNKFGKEYVGEISHWPESIGNLREGKWHKIGDKNYYFVTEATNTIGTCIVRPDFFKSWWTKDFTNGSKIVRPDNPFGPWVEFQPVKRFVPTSEFFRHMDGYGHAKVNAPIAAPLRACCTISGNSVNHNDWVRGSFFHCRKKPELPIGPSLNQKNSGTVLIDLALLCSAYKVNFKNLWFVNRAFGDKIMISSFFFSLLSFTDKFVIRKSVNLLLPIYSGNVILFKARMYLVRKYGSLSLRYNLPPSIRQFFRIRF